MNREEQDKLERVNSIRCRVSFEEALTHLNTVEHETFERSLGKYWKQSQDGNIAPQSICWLFCWAHTGMGSRKARDRCRMLFDQILDLGYESFRRDIGYEFAQEYRYKDRCQIY